MSRNKDYIQSGFAGFDRQFTILQEQAAANTAGAIPGLGISRRTKSGVRERQDASGAGGD
ncbi:MAG: hypothetical protein LBC51_07480 [Treponema sp.]|jgi:hypothetical protein|nr:hypothetical protein [Treponema sp.]